MRPVSAVLGLCAAWVALLGGQGPPPVFRADADTVAVNVSVKKGSVPVSGLTPDEFRLYDNDVLQRVAAVSMDALPVDVSFVVDTSGSAFPDLETAREAVRRMAASLRPVDRFRVLTMGSSVITAVPWQPAGPPDTSRIQYALGHISLVADSILVALVHRADPDRRHLVVALTDGEDICSLASGEALRRGAERSGAVLHWVNVEMGGPPRKNYLARSDGVASACRSATARPIDLTRVLTDAARLTGGNVHTAWSRADHMAIAHFFDAILDDFRRSYILHYVPEGVSRTGWHRLRVELQAKGLTVRARTGYWGTAAASGAPSMPATQPR